MVRVLFKFVSAVTVAVLGAFFIVEFSGLSENTAFLLGWLSIVAVGFWVPVAGASILLMAISARRPKAGVTGKSSPIEWAILAFLFLLATDLISSQFWLVWRGIMGGWLITPTLPLLSLGAGVLSLLSGIALIFRLKWALNLLLALVIALFAVANYESLRMYRASPLISFFIYAGVRNFAAMLACASYIYLKRGQADA